MFTGIVEEVGRVISFSSNHLTVGASIITRHLHLGDSVDVNGACLTVTGFDDASFSVDVMEETLARTVLSNVRPGEKLNLESALTLQKPLGGHLVQGHIDAVGEVASNERRGESTVIEVLAPPNIMRYVVDKGFIAINGISLTVTRRDDHGFGISIVDFTMKNTNLGDLNPGDKVNLEADIIAKYVEQLLLKKDDTISLEFLQEHGFLNQ